MAVKRILHVIPSVGPLRGGPSILVRSATRDLAREGLDVHVATTDDNGAHKLHVQHGTPCEEGGVTYWFFPRQTRLYTYSRPLGVWIAERVTDYDLVHVYALFSYSSVAAAYWANRRGVPYVLSPVGTLSEWGLKHRRPWAKKVSFSLLESRVIRNAAMAIYATDQEREEAERLPISAAGRVVPHALPRMPHSSVHGLFRASYPQVRGRRIVLFLSRLDEKKGLDLLITAFARLHSEKPDALLVVAGDGPAPLLQALQAQASSLGLCDQIVWTGFLDGVMKEAALADAELFVLPSRSENFGIAVLEALAAGVPVVVSDQVGIHGEITSAGAGIALPCNVDAIAHGMRRLLDEPELRGQMSKNGGALVRSRFSAKVVARQLIDTYNEVMFRRRAVDVERTGPSRREAIQPQ